MGLNKTPSHHKTARSAAEKMKILFAIRTVWFGVLFIGDKCDAAAYTNK